jgi:uncharacterized protein (DUF1697 family)
MAGTHVALFRGINVGRAKRVGMADLRTLFEDLGFDDVRTLLNSGNVAFTVPRAGKTSPAPKIEKAFTAEFGFSSRVTVLTAAELATVVEENPLAKPGRNPSRLLVSVLADPKDRARLQPLERKKWAPEALAVGKRAAYQWVPDGMLESTLVEEVMRTLGDAQTTRNWATLTKLHELVES